MMKTNENQAGRRGSNWRDYRVTVTLEAETVVSARNRREALARACDAAQEAGARPLAARIGEPEAGRRKAEAGERRAGR